MTGTPNHHTETEKLSVEEKHLIAFFNHCEWFYTICQHFEELYEIPEGRGKARLQLLEDTAHYFFFDIQRLLHTAIIQQACSLTDPQAQLSNKNLTTDFILRNCNLPPQDLENLEAIHDEMITFRKKIIPARNRMISHIDRETALSNKPLGAFTLRDLKVFQDNLQTFINIIHEHYIGGPNPMDFNAETDNLIKALKQSTYYEALCEIDAVEPTCYDVTINSKYTAA